MMKTNELVLGGLLTSLALIIPLVFGGFLTIIIPPFTATLTSHVPLFISMTISPLVAVIVAIGSTLGFLIKLGPIVAARAAMHIIVALVGANLYRKNVKFYLILLLLAPLHAFLEALIVLPFGFSLAKAGMVVGLGTLLHHLADSAITLVIVKQAFFLKKSFLKSA